MTTSGVYSYILNRNQIIEGALRLLGQLAEGEDATAGQMLNGQTSLNRMVQAWKAQNIHLWKYTEATLFLTQGQKIYKMGGSNPDRAVDTYIQTTNAVAALTGAFTITVDDATGIATTDVIGIQLDDNSMQWTTVNGAPAGNVITLTAALTDDVDIGNTVFSYKTTALVKRPEQITGVRRVQTLNAPITETQVSLLARKEYFNLSNKDNQGKVIQYYYDKQRDYGNFFAWPSADSDTDRLNFTYQKPFEIFDSSADDPDFPQEWADAVTYNLANRIAPEYGVGLDERQWIKQEASELLNEMLNYDREPASIQLVPNIIGYGND